MKSVLSILLTLAMLLSLTAGVAAGNGKVATYVTAGISYDVPAGWIEVETEDENSTSFGFHEGTDYGAMMFSVEDFSDYAFLFEVQTEEQFYTYYGNGLKKALDEGAKVTTAIEQAGAFKGAYYFVDSETLRAGTFVTRIDNNLVSLMLIDVNSPERDMHDRVIGIAASMRNSEEDMGKDSMRENTHVERVPYTLNGFTFTVPAEWRKEKTSTENVTVIFSWDALHSNRMIVRVHDLSQSAELISTFGKEDYDMLYGMMKDEIVAEYGYDLTMEPVTYGNLNGRKIIIPSGLSDFVVYVTIQNNAILSIWGADSTLSNEQIEQLIRDIVETLTWEERTEKPIAKSTEDSTDANSVFEAIKRVGNETIKKVEIADRTEYAVSGYAFTVPSDWKADESDKKSGVIKFTKVSTSLLSVMVMIQDAGDTGVSKDLDKESIYNDLETSLAEEFGGTSDSEAAIYGNISGRKMLISVGNWKVSGFVTVQDNTMIIFVAADMSLSTDKLDHVIQEIVETLTPEGTP